MKKEESVVLEWEGPITLESSREDISDQPGVYVCEYPVNSLMYYFGATKSLRWRITEHFFLTMAGYYIVPKEDTTNFQDPEMCYHHPQGREFNKLSDKTYVDKMWEHMRDTKYFYAEITGDMDAVWGVERALIQKSLERAKDKNNTPYYSANNGYRGCKHSCYDEIDIDNITDNLQLLSFLGKHMVYKKN